MSDFEARPMTAPEREMMDIRSEIAKMDVEEEGGQIDILIRNTPRREELFKRMQDLRFQSKLHDQRCLNCLK